MKGIQFEVSKEVVKLGASKVGGNPDLRSGMKYPINENGYFEFVAQINFEELRIKSELLPTKGILSLFVGSISRGEYKCFYFKEVPKDLSRLEIPISTQFAGDTDFRPTESGKIRHVQDKDINDSLCMISKSLSYKDAVFLKLIGFGELETNILFDFNNNYQVRYFGRKSGYCGIEQILESEKECFQLGGLSWEEWKEKINSFDKQKEFFTKKYNELICLMSIPTNCEIGMIWGDMLRVEFFIMKEDLVTKRFDKMVVKYTPD
jgi:uncharacterized protein YwqG